MKRPKKGDRLVYIGLYATEQDQRDLGIIDPQPVPLYPPGTVVGFRNNRFHGPEVTVQLDHEAGRTEDLYADWPIENVAPAPKA